MSELIWIDESARTSANGIVYVVAGVRAEGDRRPVHRLDELRFPAQRYLHWRDEPAARRREFLSVANELALKVTVAVTGFRIEGRGQPLDKHDEFTVTDVVRRIRHQPSPLIKVRPEVGLARTRAACEDTFGHRKKHSWPPALPEWDDWEFLGDSIGTRHAVTDFGHRKVGFRLVRSEMAARRMSKLLRQIARWLKSRRDSGSEHTLAAHWWAEELRIDLSAS